MEVSSKKVLESYFITSQVENAFPDEMGVAVFVLFIPWVMIEPIVRTTQ
jgi:hypothetical protein